MLVCAVAAVAPFSVLFSKCHCVLIILVESGVAQYLSIRSVHACVCFRCRHKFCRSCIMASLEKREKCPVCRKPLVAGTWSLFSLTYVQLQKNIFCQRHEDKFFFVRNRPTFVFHMILSLTVLQYMFSSYLSFHTHMVCPRRCRSSFWRCFDGK